MNGIAKVIEASSGKKLLSDLGLMIERSALGGYACPGWPCLQVKEPSLMGLTLHGKSCVEGKGSFW